MHSYSSINSHDGIQFFPFSRPRIIGSIIGELYQLAQVSEEFFIRKREYEIIYNFLQDTCTELVSWCINLRPHKTAQGGAHPSALSATPLLCLTDMRHSRTLKRLRHDPCCQESPRHSHRAATATPPVGSPSHSDPGGHHLSVLSWASAPESRALSCSGALWTTPPNLPRKSALTSSSPLHPHSLLLDPPAARVASESSRASPEGPQGHVKAAFQEKAENQRGLCEEPRFPH